MSISFNSPRESVTQGSRSADWGLMSLLGQLSKGSPVMFDAYAQELVMRFSRALGVSDIRSHSRDGRTQHWQVSRPPLLMRGFIKPETHVLVLADGDRAWTQATSMFWRRVASPIDLPIVLAATDEHAEVAQAAIASNFALVLTPGDLIEIVEKGGGPNALKKLLLERFTLEELHPFDDQHPVSGPMFRGRDTVLRQILHHPDVSYAIIGPSKMGKTSLIYRYIEETRRSKRDRLVLHRSLLGVPRREDDLARTLRLMLAGGADAFYDKAEHFEQFVRKFASRHPVPIDIVLDEVDDHCGLQTFHILVSLASEGLFRLILLGRWLLARTVLHIADANFVRLQPLRIEPLQAADAELILVEPLTDLQVDCSHVRHEMRAKVNQCGCVPGHVQELGIHLIAQIAARGGKSVTIEDLNKAGARVLQVSRVCGLINDLSSPLSRVAALLVILSAGKQGAIDPLWLRDAFESRGLHVGLRRVSELCDELVLHHLLSWSGITYKVARWDFAAEGQRQHRFFEEMLAEELQIAGASAPSQ